MGGQATRWQTSNRWVRASSAATFLEGACLHSCTNGKGRRYLPGRSPLGRAESLKGATMPDGQTLKGVDHPDGPTFEEWLKSEGRGEDGENE